VGGIVRFAVSTAMWVGVAFLIPMRPEGRKAGGEKIKTPQSGVIILFFVFSLFVKSLRNIKTVKIALTLTFAAKKRRGVRSSNLVPR